MTKASLQASVDEIARNLQGRLGCLICDGTGTVWAAHRADERFQTASVIKVPVLLALGAEIDAGRFRWDQPIPIAPGNTADGSGVVQYLSSLPYTLRDLATLAIIISDNRATNALIDLLGPDRINAYIARAGWRGTVLSRRMMDFDARARGHDNLSTPRDAADMFVRLLRGDLGSAETTAVLLGILKAQQLRHALPAWLPPDTAVAHKTGGLPGVVNDAGIMFLPRGPVVAAVFTNDLAQDAEGRRAIQEIGRAIAEAAR